MTTKNDMIIYYCLTENLPMLYYYKNLGVNFNQVRDKNGDTLLHLAIFEDKYSSFSILINFGMDLHLTSNLDGTTPLNFAIVCGEELYVRKLINNGVDVNRLDADGWTPLNTALLMEDVHPKLVELILKTPNIDVNIPFEKIPPIYITDDLNAVQQIVKHPSFDPTYNLILLESINNPGLEDIIRLYHTNIDESILSNYHQAKIIGMKLDFENCFGFNNLPDHGYNCFDFEGYSNKAGLKEFLSSYNHFYNEVVALSKIPCWATESFGQVKKAFDFSASTLDPSLYLKKIYANELVIIPSGWTGHSVFFVIHHDKLYRCNRGEMSDGVHGVEEFLITKPEGMTHDLIKQMLIAKGDPDFLQLDIIKLLGLNKIGEIENPGQTVGNCVWTSMEAAIEASFVDSLMEEGIDSSLAHYYGKNIFHLLEEYDIYIELLNVIENKEMLIKNELYDDLLLKALEQNHSPNNIFDIQKASIILTQINEPIFHDAFKAEIGDNINIYYPGFYNGISYMDDYGSASLYDYMKSWALYCFSKEYSTAKEYYDFLVSCDEFQAKNNVSIIGLKDVITDASIQGLEHIFISNNISSELSNNSIIPFEMKHLEIWNNSNIPNIESAFA